MRFARNLLGLRMQRADSRIHAAFETRARELAERLRDERGVAARTRVIILEQLRRGNANMPAVAKTMVMSVATLRRRPTGLPAPPPLPPAPGDALPSPPQAAARAVRAVKSATVAEAIGEREGARAIMERKCR